MRRLVLQSLVLVPFLALAASPLAAQEDRETGFMVHQWLVCPAENMEEINRMSETTTRIIKALQDEGMIRAWYDVRHAWGDEWNVGYVSVFDSHRAWLDYWDEFIRRVNAADSTLFGRFGRLCTMHKDNLLVIRDSRAAPSR